MRAPCGQLEIESAPGKVPPRTPPAMPPGSVGCAAETPVPSVRRRSPSPLLFPSRYRPGNRRVIAPPPGPRCRRARPRCRLLHCRRLASAPIRGREQPLPGASPADRPARTLEPHAAPQLPESRKHARPAITSAAHAVPLAELKACLEVRPGTERNAHPQRIRAVGQCIGADIRHPQRPAPASIHAVADPRLQPPGGVHRRTAAC